MTAPNALYYGDNLEVLRTFPAAAVDLVYLDPPFNSKRDYNLLFKSPKGQQSEAQITVFKDSWHWGEQAEREFDEVLRQANTWGEPVRGLRRTAGGRRPVTGATAVPHSSTEHPDSARNHLSSGLGRFSRTAAGTRRCRHFCEAITVLRIV